MSEAKSFDEVRQLCPIVQRTLRSGGSLADCCLALFNEKEQLFKRVLELGRICPKRLLMADGKEFVWNCPTEYIPLIRIDDYERPGLANIAYAASQIQ